MLLLFVVGALVLCGAAICAGPPPQRGSLTQTTGR